MAKVQNTRANIYEQNNTALDEATPHIESEGERLIKELVLKQIDTQVSLPDELKKTKDFTKATQYVPLTNYTCGQTSLSEFEKCANKAAYIEDLKSFGLTDEEVELLLDHEKGEEFFSAKYKKLESSILNSWLQRIFTKIQNIEKQRQDLNNQRASCSLSRHEEEVALAVKPDSEHTKLLKFALSCRQPSNNDKRPLTHPIHHLKELDEELFGHLNKKDSDPRKKSKKSLSSASVPKFKSKEPTVNKQVVFNPVTKTCEKPVTLWDLKDTCNIGTTVPKTSSTKPNHVYTCKPETLYTIKDKKIVPLNKVPPDSASAGSPSRSASSSGQPFVVPNIKESEIETLTKEDILKNRMSVEEIKLLPRFQNYDKGLPSQVLFVKNLPNRIKQADLVSVFGSFDDSREQRLIYRLMTGKMKGQAFITFPNVEKATEALDLVNGYLLRKKPMIIQYGHTNSSFFKSQN